MISNTVGPIQQTLSIDLQLIEAKGGNIVSVMVFLAPIAMLLLFYGVLKTNAALIISINVIGCVIEITYLIFYFVYASKKDKITTMIQILVLNVAAFGLVVAITFLLVGEDKRVSTVGWICAVFGVAVFAAPLLIMASLR
ncbi:hypothetical protein GBA52_006819 [Prunus armeniaca]|nr:hypothetical protein GBA52_006819 [Prunus armeniaca]